MILFNINKHFLELKNRLSLLALTWVTTICSCYTYKEIILQEMIITFQKFNPYFILTDVTELFSIHMQILFFISNQSALIFFLYHSLMFMSPGLYRKEIKTFKFITIVTLIILFISFIFTKFVTMPLIINFFFQFQKIINGVTTVPIFFEAKLKEYITFYINMYILTLVNFGLIILLVYLISNISLSFKNTKKTRKLVYFIFLIISTIVTPPDVISQLIISLLLIIIYEMSLICVSINKVTN